MKMLPHIDNNSRSLNLYAPGKRLGHDSASFV